MLGDRAKDRITGYEGIVVCVSQWLNGCDRITLQAAGLGQDGKPIEAWTADVTDIETVDCGVWAVGSRETGGPRPSPVGWSRPR